LPTEEVIVVGAGLAGLCCAADLTAAGVQTLVLEAGDGIGGRVRSDVVDGFVLDRGFQVLLTAYPEVRRRLDLGALGLGDFDPGALVAVGEDLELLADPLRRPAMLPVTLRAPVGSPLDKARVARFALRMRLAPAKRLLRRADETTAERLGRLGFSTPFVRDFWRPLFAGIQLDPELQVSSRRFELVMKMLATGRSTLPAEGIGAIPAQIASRLPSGAIRTDTPVEAVSPGEVRTAAGERFAARAIVVATEGPEANRLLGPEVRDPGSSSVSCCWFSAAGDLERPGRYLLLDGAGPALNIAALSSVQRSRAPKGTTLLAAALPGIAEVDNALAESVRAQLARRLSVSRRELEPIRVDEIRHAQPLQRPPLDARRRVALGEGLFVCGDHRDTASIQGAMFSGGRAAQAVLGHLGVVPSPTGTR
jgi:phytoene dehydrogenase-like protein